MDRSFNGAGVIAASFVLVAMVALYWNISGPLAPDWLAYEHLYQTGGGYLARQGRDPSFVVFVQWASRLFGPQAGYWSFRDALFGVFALTGVYLALRVPEQDYFGRTSFMIVAPLVVMPFLLKGLIQIREGLAFVFVAAALPSMFGRGTPRFLLLGACLAVAASIHVGAAAFLLTWVLAAALSPVDKRWLDVRSLSAILTVIGAAAGLSIALWAREHPYDVSTYLSDFRVDNRVGVEGNTAKTGYWIAMGVGMLVLRHDLLRLMSGGTATVRAFLVLLGAVLLPALYMIAATLVFIEYNLASVASLAIRLLLTAMEVAFVVIALRGGMRPLTALVLVLSVVDRARLLTP